MFCRAADVPFTVESLALLPGREAELDLSITGRKGGAQPLEKTAGVYPAFPAAGAFSQTLPAAEQRLKQLNCRRDVLIPVAWMQGFPSLLASLEDSAENWLAPHLLMPMQLATAAHSMCPCRSLRQLQH